uniref:F-box/LRR-repeat protein 14 n=1 Tax=Vitis vinifera TaxID=29760 RepID=A5BHK1_VITVI|nr:hypothetical protein VITISV_014237 [Vitis vinifera]
MGVRIQFCETVPTHRSMGGVCSRKRDQQVDEDGVQIQDIDRYTKFSMLPRDISQQIFDNFVDSHCLTSASLEAFRDCAIQDVNLGEYPEVNDSWMDIISSQGLSLLSVDLSGSSVTDDGLSLLKDCSNIQVLSFNYCDQISEPGLKNISGLSNLTSLSFKKSNTVTAEGMRAFSSLVNLAKLDLERCSRIHGGLIHLKDSDLKALSGNVCGSYLFC